MATFSERALDALNALLTDGSTGFNAETLPAMRTALGVTTAALPDVAIFERWYHRAAQATAFPYCSIVIESSSGEQGTNSRLYQTDFSLGLVVLDQNISGDEVAVLTAAWRYADAFKTLMQRRTGGQGWTLDSASGIIRAEVTLQTAGSDPTLSSPNVAVLSQVSVTTAEAY